MTSTDQRPAAGEPDERWARRRAAVIASAVAIPVTVVLAFILTSGSSSSSHSSAGKPLPAVTVAAPPSPSQATLTSCTAVFEQLPVQLGTLAPRKTDSNSGFVAAWGNPAVIIRCGVNRPAILSDPTRAKLIDIGAPDGKHVLWQPDPRAKVIVYTSVDRDVYIEVTVPPNQADPLPLLADAVNALPAVCSGYDAAGHSTPGLPICANA